MIYRYKVKCDIEDVDFEEVGIVPADSFGSAATKLEEYYGQDLLSIEKLTPIMENDHAIPFPKENGEAILDKMEDEYIW